MIQVKLHPKQYEIANDDHRYRIVAAGRRWGKSTLSRIIVLQWATKTPGDYWIVSPTYRMGKQNHWYEMQKEIPQAWIEKKNEVDLSITLKNGSTIQLKGAENPDSLRGVKLRGLVIDEIASIRNWNWLWQEVLRPTLTDYEAPAIFISTPKGYNHFYTLFLQGQEEGDYKSWRYRSSDNPHLPIGEVKAAKRDLTEDYYAQEYEADFRTAVGLAHRFWDRAIHLIKPFDIPREWQRARGFDYGSAHPTASVRVAVDPDDNFYIERSYKAPSRTIEEHANAILAQDYGLGIVPIWGDPSGAQWFTEFNKYNLYIERANKEVGQGMRGWVEHGVETINYKLKPDPGHLVIFPDGTKAYDAPKLFVLDTPENKEFVDEIERIKWRESASGETIPVLDEADDPNGHYDLMAATRYLFVSFTRQPEIAYDFNKQDDHKWAIGA